MKTGPRVGVTTLPLPVCHSEVAASAAAFVALGGSEQVVGVNLRTALHATLNNVQAISFPWAETGLLHTFDLSDDDPALLRRLMAERVPADWRIAAADRPAVVDIADAALDRISASAPDLAEAIDMLVATIVHGHHGHLGGGSNSSVIGCYWLASARLWSTETWAEHLIHEYVHQALFLDDMVRGLFAVGGAEFGSPNGLVRSAILRAARPFDRAFHSAFVSYTLMAWRSMSGHAPAGVHDVGALQRCIDELQQRSWCLTGHGQARLGELADLVAVNATALELESC